MAGDADNKEWRGKVDEELSDLKAATKTLTSVVDTLVNRISSFEQKLDAVSGGPNIAQWSGWGVGIGGLLWILITGQITGIENGARADRMWLRDRVVASEGQIENLMETRVEVAKTQARSERDQYWMEKHSDGMWAEVVKLRDELNNRSGKIARLESFTDTQEKSNARQQDRLDTLDRATSVDKDALERDAFVELRETQKADREAFEKRLERIEDRVLRASRDDHPHSEVSR